MSRFARLLGLHDQELPDVGRLAVVYAAIGGATAMGDALVQAAFLARAGADALPWVLSIRAIVSPLLAWGYTRYARKRSSRAVLASLAVVAATVALGARWVIDMRFDGGFDGAIAAYTAHEIATGLLTLHWGVFLLDHLSVAKARRGVAPIYAAARGMAALGGVAVGVLVPTFGVSNGLFVAAGGFLLIAPLAYLPRSARTNTQSTANGSIPPPPETDTRRGWQLLRSSTLLKSICVATVAMVFVRITLRYGHQAILDGIPEVELAALLGWYAAGANVLSIVLQLLVTGRLLERVGVAKTNVLYALTTLFAQLGVWFAPGGSLAIAFSAKFAEGELKHALKTPVSPLFYQGFWGADRLRARAFVLAVVSPVAQLLAAFALGALVIGPDWVASVAGTAAAVLYAAASVVQGRAYDQAMKQPLRTGESD